jgi:hypothetical protein
LIFLCSFCWLLHEDFHCKVAIIKLERQISWNFWIKYFHLICHLILSKINCITLKSAQKQILRVNRKIFDSTKIIMFSCTVMQMICAWPKIWTLSGRLSAHAHCSVDGKIYIYIYIFHVYHIRIITKKIGSHDMKQTDSSIIIVRNVCVLTKHPWLFSFSSRGHDRQSSEQNNQKLISLHNNGWGR